MVDIMTFRHYFSQHYFSRYYFSQHYFSRHYFSRHYFSQHYLSQHYFSQHYFSQHYLSQHYFSQHYFSRHYFSWHYFSQHYFSRHYFSRHYFSRHRNIAPMLHKRARTGQEMVFSARKPWRPKNATGKFHESLKFDPNCFAAFNVVSVPLGLIETKAKSALLIGFLSTDVYTNCWEGGGHLINFQVPRDGRQKMNLPYVDQTRKKRFQSATWLRLALFCTTPDFFFEKWTCQPMTLRLLYIFYVYVLCSHKATALVLL
jgi:hypothetical protein